MRGSTLIIMIMMQGGEKYQQAFYVFEELAQAPASSSVVSMVSQAVCELHLGRSEEAQAALEQAIKKARKTACQTWYRAHRNLFPSDGKTEDGVKIAVEHVLPMMAAHGKAFDEMQCMRDQQSSMGPRPRHRPSIIVCPPNGLTA